MTSVRNWAYSYVESIDPSFADLSDDDKASENLFASGRLDSMALMNLLLDSEVQFHFTFTPQAFQDRRLQTIAGLADIIAEFKTPA